MNNLYGRLSPGFAPGRKDCVTIFSKASMTEEKKIRKITLSFFNISPEVKYHIRKIEGSEAARELHSHDYYQICYVDRGEVLHCTENGAVPLRFGNAFIVPPGYIHRIDFTGSNSLIYSLSFEESLFHPGFRYSNVYRFMTALKLDSIGEKHIDVQMKVVLNESQRTTMKALMEALVREEQADCPPELTAAASLIAAVMCILSQAYFRDNTDNSEFQELSHYEEIMDRCLEYINERFTQPLTSDALARQFAFSKSLFTVLFQQYTGMTAKHYIMNKRMEYAGMLLSNTDFSINEVSLMVGYQYFSTFYRNFTRYFGVTPSEFRAHLEKRN